MARPTVTYIAPRYAASGLVNPLDPFGLLTGGPLGMPIGPQSSATTEGYGIGAGPGAVIPSTQPGAIYGPPMPNGIPVPTAAGTQTAATAPNAPRPQGQTAAPQDQPAPVVAPPPTSQPSTGTSGWAVFFVLAAGLGGAAALNHYYGKRGR